MTDRAHAKRYLTGALTGGPKPEAVGLKFDSTGQPLPTPGNTMICHVDPTSDAFAALADAQRRFMQGPLASAYTFLPPASFHMTIIEGVIEYGRSADRWPAHLPHDCDVETVTEDFAKRLHGVALDQSFQARPQSIYGGFSVRMEGADGAAEGNLRATRDRLRDATGLSRIDHDAYQFHITLAYLLRWLTEAEAETVLDLSQEVGEELVRRMPHIDLGPVEFCRFQTMHHFERVLWLN